MPGFLRGEVPNPNYEREDVNQFSQISEFTNDVYVYGTLYADIFAKDIDFGDEVEFFDLKVKNNFSVGGISTFYGPVNMDYLTVYQQLNVGAIGTVFVAISSTSEENGLVSGTVGIGTTQPNNKMCWTVSAVTKITNASTHRIDIMGLAMAMTGDARIMGGSQADITNVGGSALLIEKVANL